MQHAAHHAAPTLLSARTTVPAVTAIHWDCTRALAASRVQPLARMSVLRLTILAAATNAGADDTRLRSDLLRPCDRISAAAPVACRTHAMTIGFRTDCRRTHSPPSNESSEQKTSRRPQRSEARDTASDSAAKESASSLRAFEPRSAEALLVCCEIDSSDLRCSFGLRLCAFVLHRPRSRRTLQFASCSSSSSSVRWR